MLDAGDFCDEGSLAGQALRLGSATAMTDCVALRIDTRLMETLHREREASRYCLCPIYWRATFVTKKTGWISFLIQAKSGWHGSSCCTLILARKANLRV